MYSSNNPNNDQKSPTPPLYGQPAPPYSQPESLYSQPEPLYSQPAPPYSQPYSQPAPAPLYSQPAATGYPVQQRIVGSWSTGLCDCCPQVGDCCLTCWCPCITFGRIAEIVDNGTTSCIASGALYLVIQLLTGGCGCLYSCCYRSKMRRQYMLQERPCNDCCVHFCCEACALCQEYRELKHRGWDPSLGWEGNVHRQNPGAAMGPTAPIMPSGMTR